MDQGNGAQFLKIQNLVTFYTYGLMWISRFAIMWIISQMTLSGGLNYFILIAGSNLNQDKWRNMSVMANGWGSREKARIALKRIHSGSKDDNPLALANVDDTDDDSTYHVWLFYITIHSLKELYY